LPFAYVNGLLDSVDGPMLVTERNGKVLLINRRAKKYLEPSEQRPAGSKSFFSDFLRVESNEIFGQIEGGKHEVELEFMLGGEQCHARVSGCPSRNGWWCILWLPHWRRSEKRNATDGAELLQERKSLSKSAGCYLKLQEVNRQKTVFWLPQRTN